MSNRAALAQLRDMTPGQVNILPMEQIALLLEDVADQKAELLRLSELLNVSLAHRYSDTAAQARRQAGKDTGTVTLQDGDFAIKADLPAKVEWDQRALQTAMETVREWGEDPTHYLAIVLSVPENRYKAWPETIRAVFQPARTIGTGKPTYKVERAKRGAA